MSSDRPPAHVPTLTEVVTWPKPPAGAPAVAPPVVAPPAVAPPVVSPPVMAAPVAASPVAASPVAAAPIEPSPVTTPSSAPPQPSEGELVDRVLANLHRQVDLALEVKLREALAPVLARATDTIVREARRELTSTLRELVARAIAQELARRGQR